jgi:hypothetical protein
MRNYLFDGKPPEKTHRNFWYKIDAIPKKIEQSIAERKTNIGAKLKQENISFSTFPAELPYKDVFYEDAEYYHISGLYEPVYKVEPAHTVERPFKVNIIAEKESFEFIQMDWTPKASILDSIRYEEALHVDLPCRLTKAESYSIIRNFIKENIDPKHARVTSDYDFCFSVEKIIDLGRKEAYRVDVSGLRAKRPKYETRYRTERRIKIYESSPNNYQSYPDVIQFEGSSHADLKEKVQKYLDDLIAEINRPLTDCQACKGMGIV